KIPSRASAVSSAARGVSYLVLLEPWFSSPGARLAAALNDFGFGKSKNKRGDKCGFAARDIPHGLQNGFVSWTTNAPSATQGIRPAGTRNALPGSKNLKLLLLDSVGKRQTHVVHVRGVHLNFIQQLALTPRLLRA